jgi:hypothetical protein
VSSRSSGGSDEREALGVDFSEEILLTDRVFLSARPEILEGVDDCWDWEFGGRALDDLRGEGGAIEGGDGDGRGGESWMEGRNRLNQRS